MIEYTKPLPRPNLETREFWDACRRHELVIQRCRGCRSYRFYPSPMCHKCGSTDADWVKLSGKGRVYSWIVVHAPVDPVWADEVPYIAVIVELAEQAGVLMPSNLVNCDPKDVRAGMPVEVVFDDVTDEITLPKWRPVSDGKVQGTDE